MCGTATCVSEGSLDFEKSADFHAHVSQWYTHARCCAVENTYYSDMSRLEHVGMRCTEHAWRSCVCLRGLLGLEEVMLTFRSGISTHDAAQSKMHTLLTYHALNMSVCAV